MATWTEPVYRANGGERVLEVQLVSPGGWALHAANYYAVAVRVRRSGQSNGETLGSISTATRTLTAGSPVTLYSSGTGTRLDAGDTIYAYTESTGTPATGFRASISVEMQR